VIITSRGGDEGRGEGREKVKEGRGGEKGMEGTGWSPNFGS